MSKKGFNKGHLIGRTLARKRRMVGMTQHELARSSGIAVGRVVFIETDRIVPEPEELDAIRTVLKSRAREVAKEIALS